MQSRRKKSDEPSKSGEGDRDQGRLLLPWSVLRGGGSPTYSDYRFIKIHIPKIGSKFGPDKFRTNSGYMCFFNHITTVRG